MQSIMIFLQLAGAVALLLFGLHLVRDGMTEAFGVRLKLILGRGTKTGPRAFLTGLIATLGLQSSTATALMTASFVERELIAPRMAQIALLGANIGTALTAWIVSAGLEAMGPALIFLGAILRTRSGSGIKGSGTALTGLGLMLLSLTLLGQATLPLRASPAMAAFLGMLDNAWPVALVFSALLAVICSSSLAVVLLIASLTLSPGLTVVMVLGANLGGAVPPVLATIEGARAARHLTVANLATRLIGCLLALPFAGFAGGWLAALDLPLPKAGLALEAHLSFNLLLAALIWPFTGLISRMVNALLPVPEAPLDAAPNWLVEDELSKPQLALTGASREVLAIGDLVERMLDQSQYAFQHDDPGPLHEVALLEDQVDRRQQLVKSYLSRLGPEASEADRRRSITILDYVINLEHAGDIIDKGLRPEIQKKISRDLRFSDEGYAELQTMFMMTRDNLRMAQTVFMTSDRELARRLMQVKVDIRNLERQSSHQHLLRLRDGQLESHQTSSLHLDLLRDLKRVNAHLVAVAHLLLEQDGMLVESRVKTG